MVEQRSGRDAFDGRHADEDSGLGTNFFQCANGSRYDLSVRHVTSCGKLDTAASHDVAVHT